MVIWFQVNTVEKTFQRRSFPKDEIAVIKPCQNGCQVLWVKVVKLMVCPAVKAIIVVETSRVKREKKFTTGLLIVGIRIRITMVSWLRNLLWIGN